MILDLIDIFLIEFNPHSLRDSEHQSLQHSKGLFTNSPVNQRKQIASEKTTKLFCFEGFDVFLNIARIPLH